MAQPQRIGRRWRRVREVAVRLEVIAKQLQRRRPADPFVPEDAAELGVVYRSAQALRDSAQSRQAAVTAA